MNIKNLDFQNDVGENSQISGGQGADNYSERFEQRFVSLTGENIGNFRTFSDGRANGTHQAEVNFTPNFNSDTNNKVSFSYSTSTSGFATTPGS